LKRFACYREFVADSSLNVGDVIEVTTDRLAYGGDAVARHDGLAVFIPLAAPGERLRIRITERKKTFARGAIDRILAASPARRVAPCQYFGDCGGCQLQHLTYEAQLEAKAAFVRDALERIGHIDWPHEIPVLHAAEFGYRARAQVKIDRKTRRIGFHRASSNAVCDVESCPILTPELDEALRSIRDALSRENPPGASAGVSQIEISAGESGVSFEPRVEDFSGGALRRTVHEAVYSFSPSTFFQANPGLLDDLIDEALGEDTGELGIDLYAGVGLFTVQLARRFRRVIGVESDPIAAKFALENITANDRANVEFHVSRVESLLEKLVETKISQPDLILLDPPRTGAADPLPHIIALKPKRVTYVSCDPATLARDLRRLIDSGYEPSRITAIDLFPQTYHVEVVAALVRELR